MGQRNCFLNVVIQSLWHLRHFRHKFILACEERKSSTAPGEGEENVAAGQVLSALHDVFSAYNSALEDESSQCVVESSSLRNALSKVSIKEFNGFFDT